MSMTEGPDDHDHDESLPDDLRAQFDLMLQRSEDFLDDLRKIGLYAEGPPQFAQIPTPMGPQPGMILQCNIGKVAFSDRIQHPEKYETDKSFAVIDIGAQDDAYLDERARIQQAIAEGRDPYFDEADDDDD